MLRRPRPPRTTSAARQNNHRHQAPSNTPLDSPTHAARQRWARGSERIPRLSAANLGVARSYTLTYTRTAALVCACASSSHGAAPAEHVRCTLEREHRWTGAMVNCREACASGAICPRTSLCMGAISVLCYLRFEQSLLRDSIADFSRLPVSTGQTSS